jgi:O-antigen/teichoic acid export membrane protein
VQVSNKKQRAIKDGPTFTGARYFSQGIGFFTAIALRKFLGSFNMGIWSLLKVLLGYLSYMFVDVNQGASNKTPLYAGQWDVRSESEIVQSGRSWKE